MKPDTHRPDAAGTGGDVYVFVGGTYQMMTVQAAESLHMKLGEAIEKAKASASEEPTA
jgi:hypothetical protein